MSTLIKTFHAGVIAAFACLAHTNASAADADATTVSPGYMGADVGAIVYDGHTSALTRVYGGRTIGGNVAFGLQQVHALELMLYTTKLRSNDHLVYPSYLIQGPRTRASGAAVSWTSALKLNDSWSLTSRLGATFTHAKTEYGGQSLYAGYGWHHNSAGIIAGVGAAYKLSRNVSATLDMNYMPIERDSYSKSDPATVSAGLKYHF
jgi:opacity protein-like surface antigen